MSSPRRLGAFIELLACCPPRVPATLDWYVASQSDGRGWLLITDDRDDEFAQVRRRARLSTFRDALTQLSP